MNLNQFQYLLAIYKCGSITKAAQELFVSVPSISSAIRNLEDELGCILLIRHRQGVTFTEQGEEAVRLLREVDERLVQLSQLAYYQDTTLTGHIKLGGTPHLNHALVLPMLVRLHERYPELKITPIDGDSQSILRMIAQGSLDLGVILFCNIDEATFLREIHRNHLHFEELTQDEMGFVVRQGHPLATSNTVSLQDILQYPYYTYHHALNDPTMDLFLSYNPELEVVQLDDRDLLRHMLLYSNASTLMPFISSEGTMEHYPGLTVLHIADFSYHCRIGWLHRNEPLSRIEKAVIATLEEETTNNSKQTSD